MEEGRDNWKRLENFIHEITKGGLSVMYEVQVHAVALIKRILAVRCESSFRNNSGGKKDLNVIVHCRMIKLTWLHDVNVKKGLVV